MSAPAQQLSALAGVPLSQDVFDKFRALIYEKTGIHMREGKQILIANRLRKRLAELKLSSYEEYYSLLTSRSVPDQEMANFIDAVSTNETYFFREGNHFTALSNTILPELFRSSGRVRTRGPRTDEMPMILCASSCARRIDPPMRSSRCSRPATACRLTARPSKTGSRT